MASDGYDGVGNILHLQGMSPYNDNPSNDLTSTPSGNYTYDANGNTQTDTSGKAYTWDWGLNSPGLGQCALVLIILLICAELTGCGSTTSPTGNGSAPTIASFTADPTSINSGTSSTLSWMVAGATSIAITPGTFTSTSATGTTSVSPTVTTTYTLTATNAAGSTTSTLTVTVNTTSKPTISSFTASPPSINSGSSSTLNWATTGATGIAITPGTFTSTSASGSTSVSPTMTTTYTLTATNAAGSTTSTLTVTVNTTSKPTISSFTASPPSITSGSSSTLSWATTGATSIAITPGTFTSTSASGSTSVSPTVTTTYTLTATNAAGSTTSTAKVTVTASGGPLAITTTSCPGGTQGAAYAGCTIVASGGSPPYTFSVAENSSVPPLPEGMSLDATTGAISSSLIGGQGTYTPEFVVTDSTSAQATQDISIAINGNNAFLANIFPSTSIFHHRVDAATTSLPVDTSPAAPMYSGYLSATVKPFFGNNSDAPFPNGIPAIEVPLQPGRRLGYNHGLSILFHLGSNSRLCSGGRHQQLDGRSARSGLPGGRRWKRPRPLRNVAGNIRKRSLDRFLQRALAQRIFE